MDKKRSEELEKMAVRLYAKLRSTLKVGRKLGLSPSVVYRILVRNGVQIPKRHAPEVQQAKKSLQGERAKEVAKDYAAGMTFPAMMRKHKVGRWAIQTAVKDNGVQLRGKGAHARKFTEEEMADIKRLYTDEKWSQEQLGAKYKTSQTTLGRLLLSMGVNTRLRSSGENHGSWSGGRVRIGSYVGVWVSTDDPLRCMAHKTGYVLEHRLVMARLLGRPLTEDETVHHIDDDKTNNEPSNLQLRFGRHGKGVVLKCRCCGSSDIMPVELD